MLLEVFHCQLQRVFLLPLLFAGKIETLLLRKLHFSSLSTSKFAKYLLSSACSLRGLKLYSVYFTSTEAFDNLVHSATVSKCLKKLSISLWHVRREHVSVLAESLAVVERTLEEIDLKNK